MEIITNCQHPGEWGPWYHLSKYRFNPKTGKYNFVAELCRSGRGDDRYPYGHPSQMTANEIAKGTIQ